MFSISEPSEEEIVNIFTPKKNRSFIVSSDDLKADKEPFSKINKLTSKYSFEIVNEIAKQEKIKLSKKRDLSLENSSTEHIIQKEISKYFKKIYKNNLKQTKSPNTFDFQL